METNTPEKHKEFFRKLKALLDDYGVAIMCANNGDARIRFEEITSDRTEVYYSVRFEGENYFGEGFKASLSVVRNIKLRRDVEL